MSDFTSVDVIDPDNNGTLELIAAANDGRIAVNDGVTKEITFLNTGFEILSLSPSLLAPVSFKVESASPSSVPMRRAGSSPSSLLRWLLYDLLRAVRIINKIVNAKHSAIYPILIISGVIFSLRSGIRFGKVDIGY